MENAALYAKYHDNRHWDKHPTIYAERFARFLKDQEFTGRLVDLGCGTGRDVEIFTKMGFDASGLDIGQYEIDIARRYRPDCLFEVGDIHNLPYANSSIGAYFMINVIHCVDQFWALRHMWRTLVPGGILYIHFNLRIVDPQGHTIFFQEESSVTHLIRDWIVLERILFKRIDTEPLEYTHTILELILQIPS